MTRVAITGYASLDHVALLEGVPQPGTTTRIAARPAWPRLGGSPAYVAAALAASKAAEPVPLSWVGDDAPGAGYCAALTALGVRSDGIAILPGVRTPMAILAYQPDGGCYCLYDPGQVEPPGLSAAQANLLAGADWVCLTVGPAAVTDAVLDSVSPATRVAWVVKHDAHAVAKAQAARLATRADLICYSRTEAAFVAAAGRVRCDAVVVETHGAEAAVISWNDDRVTVPIEALPVRDPTGAGDTLAGGVIAALIANPDDKPGALRAGVAAAGSMLLSRERNENP